MKVILLLGVFALMFTFQVRAMDPLSIGSSIPDVTAVAQDDSKFSLKKEASRGWVLFFFYPKAMTPGCTDQACSLRDAYVDLQAQGVQVYGVSADSTVSQQKFKEKQNLPYTLIADSDKTVINAFGVSTTFGLASRQAFLFKDGKLVWHDPQASTKKQAEDILKVLSEHK